LYMTHCNPISLYNLNTWVLWTNPSIDNIKKKIRLYLDLKVSEELHFALKPKMPADAQFPFCLQERQTARSPPFGPRSP
jgi:hypothetical protein